MAVIRSLDRLSFAEWFLRHGGSRASLERLWDPIAYALGFLDCQAISARCMLTIFMMFAARTEASKLNMLKGSPHRWLHGPLLRYIETHGGRLHLRHRVRTIHEQEHGGATRVTGLSLTTPTGERQVQADAYLAACDVPGIQRLLPEHWKRRHAQFANIDQLGRSLDQGRKRAHHCPHGRPGAPPVPLQQRFHPAVGQRGQAGPVPVPGSSRHGALPP